jgi:hypothetical protein
VEAHLSEMFPYSGDLRNPYCRSGCGLLGNWFADIPAQLPAANRLKCRQCLGIEIEAAQLICPQCSWSMLVEDGVLIPETRNAVEERPEEEHLLNDTGQAIGRLLNLNNGDLVLVLAPLSQTVLEQWGCSGIEVVRVELQPQAIVSHRAKSCADGHGVVHYIAGPIKIEILRPGEFDAIVVSMPSDDLADTPANLACLPGLLHLSGRMVLIYHRIGPRMPPLKRTRLYLENLPDSFAGFKVSLTRSGNLDLLLFEPPDENGTAHGPDENVVNGKE